MVTAAAYVRPAAAALLAAVEAGLEDLPLTWDAGADPAVDCALSGAAVAAATGAAIGMCRMVAWLALGVGLSAP